MAHSETFLAQKAVGTAAETALCHLLTSAGGIVTLNQVNSDAVQARHGAAVAHIADNQTHHLPDLSVLWPNRHVARRISIEAKTKSPLAKGGWGWDKTGFDRAFRWSVLTGDPVLYAIRDNRIPMPAPGQPDEADHWVFASVWKLMHSPTRTESGPYYYWPADDFLPLAVLLENLYGAALVPVVWLDDGPPIIL